VQILYILILTVFFGGVSFYLVNYSLVPYTVENILDVRNVVIVSISLVLTITFVFSFFHLLLDKLFFRKFYESPRTFLALRRGFLVGFLLVGYAWLKIFDFWTPSVILIFSSLFPLIEALFLGLFLSKKTKKEKNNDTASVSSE